MLNMESASAGAAIAGLSKTLTTPFSINDILTRSKPRRVSDSELQRAGSRSPPPPQPQPLCCRDLSLGTGSNPGQQASSYLQYYAAAAMDNNNPAAATSSCSAASTSTSSNSASSTTTAGGLPVDYVQRKLGYFGAALSAAALPLDMRRCNAASNDSGKLPLFRLMDSIIRLLQLLQLLLLCCLSLCANFLFVFCFSLLQTATRRRR